MDGIRARRALWVLALAAAGACSTAPPSSDEDLRKIKDPDVVFVPTPQEVVDMMLHLARVGPKDVVFLYLLPRLNVRLIPQLEKLKPGSRIVSHDFDMKGVRPDAVVSLRCREDDSSHRIYL